MKVYQAIATYLAAYLATMNDRVEIEFSVVNTNEKFVKPFVEYVAKRDVQIGQYLNAQYVKYANDAEVDDWNEFFTGTKRMINDWYINKFIDYLVLMVD